MPVKTIMHHTNAHCAYSFPYSTLMSISAPPQIQQPHYNNLSTLVFGLGINNPSNSERGTEISNLRGATQAAICAQPRDSHALLFLLHAAI
jgi:hypothetical protein